MIISFEYIINEIKIEIINSSKIRKILIPNI